MATNPLLLGIASNSSLNFQIPSISIKLDRDNYSLWRSTIISALETFKLEAFVLAPAPPAETITVSPTGNQRFVSGLVAADYFAASYFVWAVLITNLARIGYEEKNMYMVAHDWRLSFQNTEVHDQSLSRMKNNIELMVATTGEKVVVIPHSMGVLYFLHFMKWVETLPPMGGGGGSDWCSKHIKAVMNIGGPFLGLPKIVAGLFSAEAKDIAVARAVAPGVLDLDIFGFQTLQHAMRMTLTWDSTM